MVFEDLASPLPPVGVLLGVRVSEQGCQIEGWLWSLPQSSLSGPSDNWAFPVQLLQQCHFCRGSGRKRWETPEGKEGLCLLLQWGKGADQEGWGGKCCQEAGRVQLSHSLPFQQHCFCWSVTSQSTSQLPRHEVIPWEKQCCWKGSQCNNWALPCLENTIKIFKFSLLRFAGKEFQWENKAFIYGPHLHNTVTSCLMLVPWMLFHPLNEMGFTSHWRGLQGSEDFSCAGEPSKEGGSLEADGQKECEKRSSWTRTTVTTFSLQGSWDRKGNHSRAYFRGSLNIFQ